MLGVFRVRNWTLQTKLFLTILAAAVLMSGMLGVTIYRHQQDTLIADLDRELLRSALIFAAGLNLDDVARLARDGQAATGASELIAWASRVKQNSGLAYVYTFVPIDETQAVFGVVDGELTPGGIYHFEGTGLEKAWSIALGGTSAVSDIYTDDYGAVKSALVPLLDESGATVAVAGVDVHAGMVLGMLDNLKRTILLAGAVVFLVWLGVAFIAARVMVGPVAAALNRYGDLIGRVARGDLTMDEIVVTSDDEVGRLGRAFNQAVGNLRTLVRSVMTSAGDVLSASASLSAAAEQSTQGAQGAAQAVHQVAEGTTVQANEADGARQRIQQLNDAIQRIARGAQQSAEAVQRTSVILGEAAEAVVRVAQESEQVADSARHAQESARSGEQVVARVVDGMDRIRSATVEVADRVRRLGEMSTRIGDITDVIANIAEQTNLLALNAAIEAARAGEHGRGFAVVAEEVRKLAERSAASAREIGDIIAATQQGTEEAMKAMEASQSEVAAGTELTAEAQAALASILGAVEAAAGGVAEISNEAQVLRSRVDQIVEAIDTLAAHSEEQLEASRQMTAASDGMAETVEHMARSAQENAAATEQVSAVMEEVTATSEEVAASAQSLARIARELQNQVAQFHVEAGHGDAVTAAPPIEADVANGLAAPDLQGPVNPIGDEMLQEKVQERAS